MAKYPLISAKQVLARTIRNLGYKLPSTYMDDILEWIPEGMGEMEVTQSLIRVSTGGQGDQDALYVKNHCVQLPCGYRAVIAIEDENGRRLPVGGDQTDFTKQSSIRHISVGISGQPRTTVFEVNPFQHQTADGLPTDEPAESFPWFGQDITTTPGTNRSTHYYQIVGNHIQTSFEEGFIRLHYLSIPVCKEGYPLIPDNENFKRALEWHVIRRLIGSGYKHEVFSYEYANQEFERYAGRAMGEVSFYTPDDAAKLNRSIIRLIPPHQYQNDFFTNSEQDERLFK